MATDEPNPPPRGPLAGYTVLDITQMIAGPVGGSLLGDMGADVIKVEPIDGESTRHTVSVIPLEGLGFILYNRGKRSIPVDLRKAEGRDVVHRLVAQADAAVVGYRPDVCLAFGLDYETLSRVNPRLIYLQNTAFGSEGPMALQGGYDIVVQGLSGLMALNQGVDDNGQPRPIVPAYADYLTGALIAWGATAAFMVRERTGEGQKVETSLLLSALTGAMGRVRYFESVDHETLPEAIAKIREAQARNLPWKDQLALRADARVIPANVYYRAYATADSYLIVACLNNPTRVKLLRLLGLEDFRIKDGRLVTTVEPDEDAELRKTRLRQLVDDAEAVVRSRTTGEWLQLLSDAKIPSGPLRFPEEVFDDPQVLANRYLIDLEHPLMGRYKTTAPPVRMSKTPLSVRSTAPLFGEHTRQILQGLGYDETAIAALIEHKVVAARD
jgi:crotonobetainyl-CoA:carnitine CoA-transferase CaiB-like acyl-CoA transferase